MSARFEACVCKDLTLTSSACEKRIDVGRDIPKGPVQLLDFSNTSQQALWLFDNKLQLLASFEQGLDRKSTLH